MKIFSKFILIAKYRSIFALTFYVVYSLHLVLFDSSYQPGFVSIFEFCISSPWSSIAHFCCTTSTSCFLGTFMALVLCFFCPDGRGIQTRQCNSNYINYFPFLLSSAPLICLQGCVLKIPLLHSIQILEGISVRKSQRYLCISFHA